jgi:hypothetical protein
LTLFRLRAAAFTESKNHVYGVVVSESKQVVFSSLQKLPTTPGPPPPPEPPVSPRQIQWLTGASPAAVAVAFNPLGDYALLVTSGLQLLVLSVGRLLPDNRVFGSAESSGLGWDQQLVTRVYPGPGQESWGAPSALLWWETSDFLQLGLVGTQNGTLAVVNLVTKTLVGTCR